MTDAKTETQRHVCSYPVQPRDDDGNPQDRTRCLVPGCEVRRGRTVPVDEAFLRSVLRDALAFNVALANSGDPEAPDFIAEYELALLQLPDAPALTEYEEWGIGFDALEMAGLPVWDKDDRESAEADVRKGFGDFMVTRTTTAGSTPWQRVEVTGEH